MCIRDRGWSAAARSAPQRPVAQAPCSIPAGPLWRPPQRPRMDLKLRTSVQNPRAQRHRASFSKRMLYAVEPLGSGRWFSTSDPYVVAAEASRGGLLGYCTALELLGVVEPSGLPLTTLIPRPTKEYEIGGHRHIQYLTPKALRDSGQEDLGVVRVPRNGTWIPCTGLERTVIDILQRSDRAGGLGWAITTLVAVAHCIGAYSGTQAGHACRPRPTDQTIPCTNPIPRL